MILLALANERVQNNAKNKIVQRTHIFDHIVARRIYADVSHAFNVETELL